MSKGVLSMSADELQTMRRIANSGAVISRLRALDVARLKRLKFIECGARLVHLTDRGRAFLARQEAGKRGTTEIAARPVVELELKAKGGKRGGRCDG